MKKRFKSKNNKIKKKTNSIVIILVIILLISLVYFLLLKIPYKIDNKVLANILSSNFNNETNIENIYYKNKTKKNITSLLKQNYLQVNIPTIKEEKPIKKEESNKKEDPLIYIYNTHQTEEYKSNQFVPYTINPNVMMNSYILQNEFNKNNLPTLVEERSVKEHLHQNGYTYSYSYIISKQFMESAKLNNPSLKYYIDVHRDSQPAKITTVEINNKSYAKLLFIVGLENDNHIENLTFTQKINDKLNEYYPNLSRGILKKSGANVNGIYNQDFSPYAILLEVGGVDNQVDEVLNSLLAFSKCYMEVVEIYEN